MDKIISEIEKVIKGKTFQIKLILASFIAKQHVLINDIPGVGKTTLAKTISKVLGLEFKRVQFTADMLPSDILGVNYFDIQKKEFIFKKGAIFSEIILADEINRATPKAQSALLEAMEERQVTIDGITYKLSDNFFVIATQNPKEHGIYPLPLSQIDRFGLSLSLGYPDRNFEKLILQRKKIEVNPVKFKINHNIYIDEKIYNLLLDIASISREIYEIGLSTRAIISMQEIAKAWAFINNREFIIDQDIFDILPYTINHRLKDNEADKKILSHIK